MVNTIYLHPSWGQLQQKKENGISECFHYESDAGEIIYSYIKRKAGIVNGITYFDIVTPRGEGGPIIIKQNSNTLVGEFDKSFSEYCNSNKIIAEYIRFDPWNTKSSDFSEIYTIEPHGKAYCHKLQEDFFMTQYSSKRRNQIRKAQSSGVTVILNVGDAGVDTFLELYHYVDEKHSIGDYYKLSKEFLQGYFGTFGDRVNLGFAYYEEKVIAAGMFLNGGDVYHYHFSASHPEYTNLNAISYLLMEEAKYGASQGCTLMDLGGATPGSGLEKFKTSMTRPAQILDCYVGKAIRNPPIYNALVDRCGGPHDGMFPEYR